MNSNKPYLIRAFYEWIVDNNCTPHIVVDINYANLLIPKGLDSDGQLVLNISPNAIRNMQMDNDAITFEGRFSGVPFHLYIPNEAVLAIYARENGQGMVFEVSPVLENTPAVEEVIVPVNLEDDETDNADATFYSEKKRPNGRPSLKIVK
ncbi:UNVERIFIED_CONTAM: hypothetical protein GTU68_056398 [Idotea baltica]|nr:hypothetical protein [Idotea baltica]